MPRQKQKYINFSGSCTIAPYNIPIEPRVMRFLFIKTLSLFVLLLANMSLYMWLFNSLGKHQLLDENFIKNVHAETNISHGKSALPAAIANKSLVSATTQPQPSAKAERSSYIPASQKKTNPQRLYLKFARTQSQLSAEETQRLIAHLKARQFNRASKATILVGPVPTENSTLTPQTARLRAQNIARQIFSYTQNIQIKLVGANQVPAGQVAIDLPEPEMTTIVN